MSEVAKKLRFKGVFKRGTDRRTFTFTLPGHLDLAGNRDLIEEYVKVKSEDGWELLSTEIEFLDDNDRPMY